MSPEEQRTTALAKANAVRLQRAALKRSAKEDRSVVTDALLDPEDWMLGMVVLHLLCSVRRLGSKSARRMLLKAGIDRSVHETKTIGDLTERQRREVVRALSQMGTQPRRGWVAA